MVKNIDLILFDIDGTLVDSREDVARAVNGTLEIMGREKKTTAEVSLYIGLGMDILWRRVLNTNDDILTGKAVDLFTDYRHDHPHDSSVLYANVESVLKHFSRQKKIIVSNRREEFSRMTLKALNIEKYFDDVIGPENIDCAKPSPYLLNEIITRHKARRDRAIMVGDMDVDVQAGKDAGIVTCAVTYGLGFREDIVKARPDFIIDNIIELKDII